MATRRSQRIANRINPSNLSSQGDLPPQIPESNGLKLKLNYDQILNVKRKRTNKNLYTKGWELELERIAIFLFVNICLQ